MIKASTLDLVSLLYVSTSMIPPSQAEAEVADIVEKAQQSNMNQHITGALIFTETRFAQIVEGPSAAIDRLLARLRSDNRHSDIHVLLREQIQRRQFTDWSMAYAGPSVLIAHAVSKPIYDIMRGTKPDARALMDMMTSFRFGQAA